MTPKLARMAAGLLAVAITGFVAGKYLLLLGPAAAREKSAACRGLRPKPSNPTLLGRARGFPIMAPDIQVQDSTGAVQKLSDYRGKVVFLNFWATWCPPCVAEVPHIEALQRELADEGLVVLAVASSSEWGSISNFFPDGTNLRILIDPPEDEDERIGKVARGYGVPALPETFLVDKHGYIRYYFVNKRDWNSSVAVTCVRSLIEEETSLAWLKSWLSTMSPTSFGS